MVHEHVAGPDAGEEVRCLGGAAEPRLGGRRPGLRLQVRPVEAGEHHEVVEPQQAVDGVDVAGRELELVDQQRQHRGRHSRLDLQAHPPRPPALAPELDLDRGQQVLGLAVHIVQVGVASDPENVVSRDLHAREERLQVVGDHLLEGHEARAVGQDHEAGQQGRHLDAGEALPPAQRIAHQHGQVQREIRDVREGVAGVDRQRRQDREDALAKLGGEVLTVGVAELGRVADHDAGVPELGLQLLHEKTRVALHETFHAAPDRAQLAGGREAVRRGQGLR